jgi:hypothetical protein
MGMVEGTNFRGENIQSGLGGITSVSDDKTQPDKKITDSLVLDQLEIGELEQQILPMTSQKQPVTITLVEY